MHVRIFGGEGWPLAVCGWCVMPVLSHCTRLGIGRGRTRRRRFHSPRAAGGRARESGTALPAASGREGNFRAAVGAGGPRSQVAVPPRSWPFCRQHCHPTAANLPTRQQNLQPLPVHHPSPRRPTATPRGPASPTTKVCLLDRRHGHVPLLGRARPFRHFPLSHPLGVGEHWRFWGFRCFVE